MRNSITALALAAVCSTMLIGTPAKADVYFRDNDRVVLRTYVEKPSDTVTVYHTGEILPDTVTYTTLPDTVVTKLAPPPTADTYVTYGGNAYLIDKDRHVVDTISLY